MNVALDQVTRMVEGVATKLAQLWWQNVDDASSGSQDATDLIKSWPATPPKRTSN